MQNTIRERRNNDYEPYVEEVGQMILDFIDSEIEEQEIRFPKLSADSLFKAVKEIVWSYGYEVDVNRYYDKVILENMA